MLRVIIAFSVALIISVQAWAGNWNKSKDTHTGRVATAHTPSEAINNTTSRKKRTGYLCEIATKPNMKPAPRGMDAFRMDRANVGYADLYGDGSIELIAGFGDEMLRSDHWLWKDGNKDRSTNYSTYMLFSPNSKTKKPDDFEFFMARNIIPSDFNNDGIDDVLFVQHGQDFKPFKGQPNFVLLSAGNSYKKIKLDGSVSVHHGGATGDVDGDGDVDIIVTPANAERGYSEKQFSVGLYLNNRLGSFQYVDLLRSKKRYANVQLWDIDGDGFLDAILDGHAPTLSIFWGSGRSGGSTDNFFTSKPTTIPKLNAHFMQDIEFADLDGNGKPELIILSSLEGDGNYYGGFSIHRAEFSDRKLTNFFLIHEEIGEKGEWLWHPYISACDLQMDGDMDLVIEVHGQQGGATMEKLDKLIFENKSGTLVRHRLETKMYHTGNFYELSKIEKLAAYLGVSTSRYEPSVEHFSIPKDIQNSKKHHINKDGVFHVWSR